MSNAQPTKTRTTADIQNENAQLTFKAGQLQYVARQTQKDLDMINDKLRDLALEYVSVKAKEDEVVRLVAEAKSKEDEAGKAILQAVGSPQTPQIPPGVDQASTQPGSGTKESAPE